MKSIFSNFKKISSVFLVNNLLLFTTILTILILSMAFFLFLLIVNFKDDLYPRYQAAEIISDDIESIDPRDVIETGGWAAVTDSGFRILRSFNSPDSEGYVFDIREIMTMLYNSDTSRKYLYSGSYSENGEYFVITAVPKEMVSLGTYIKIDENENGLLFLELSEFRKKDETPDTRLQTVFIYSVIFFVVLLIIVLYFDSKIISGKIVKPLQKLDKGMKSIRNGNYCLKTEIEDKSEIGRLATSFEEMAERIRKDVLKLENSEKERIKLITDISHDLKNPLSSIVGYSEYLIGKEVISENDRNRFLRIINSNGKRADNLINELFFVSRLENPFYKLDLYLEDINEFLRELIAERIPEFEEKGFAYEFDIPEKEYRLYFDKKQFSRVINNLFDNSVKHNKSGCTLGLSVVKSAMELEINITDNGRGLPEYLKGNPFGQIDRSIGCEECDSHGIGLLIVKGIVKKHGWEITVDDNHGSGVRYSIKIPNE